MEIFVQKDTIMKKTYMAPEIQVVEVELHLLDNTSPRSMGVNSSTTVSDPNAVLGRGGSDWDDEDF